MYSAIQSRNGDGKERVLTEAGMVAATPTPWRPRRILIVIASEQSSSVTHDNSWPQRMLTIRKATPKSKHGRKNSAEEESSLASV
jgi:hypothetical protein